MKSTFLTLLLAVQLAAVPAFAQTAATTTTTGATTGTSGAGMTSDTFGGDWSTTLGLAMFGDDGTMIRSDSELANQWATLSDDDKDMIRRDCLHMEQSGGLTGSTTGNTAGSAAGTTSGAAATGSGAMINVSMEQMEQICAATKDL